MNKHENKRGRKRIYDAQKTREKILSAAVSAFAEHGFNGTSIDSIAAEAGYNKSLIFQYFGDKQGLYYEVLRQTDCELSGLLACLLELPLQELSDGCDKELLISFIRKIIESLIDFMIDHPNFMRLMNWEQAEGWNSLAKISSQLEPTYSAQIEMQFRKAQKAGLIRADIDIFITFLLIQQMCWSAPALFPLFKSIPGSNSELLLSDIRMNFRNQIISFIMAGIMQNPPKDMKNSNGA